MNRKQEMYEKLEQIRNLISTDHDRNENSQDESQLGNLVESFYSDYMSLNSNHNRKVKKLQKSDSISSTSSSESNDSNGQEEIELEEELQAKKSRIMSLEEEIFDLRSEKELLRVEVERLKSRNDKLQEENSLLQRTVTELKLQKSDLERILEEKVPAMLNELEGLSIEPYYEIDGISERLDLLQKPEEKQISTLEENLERIVKRTKSRFENFSSTNKFLQELNRSSSANLETALEKIEVLKSKEIGHLAEKKNLEKEISKLHELIESLEVHLRLTNQRFKVTKSEFKQKDELHKKKMKEVQENCKNLESQNREMFEEIKYMEYMFRKIKEDSEGELTGLTDAFQNFELVMDEKIGHYRMRLKDCHEDVRVLKDELRTLIVSKKDLEKNLKQKEEECLLKDEEKREAIRQLCLQIDYHREKYSKQLIQRSSVSFHGTRRSRKI